MFAVQSCNQSKDNLGRAAIQIARRLVGQKELRPGDQRPGQSQALLFTAGKLAGSMMGPLLQSDLAQPTGSLAFCFRASLAADQ